MTPVSAFLSSLLVAEGYNQYSTPEQKRSWQSRMNMHHGEAGVIIAFIGALAGSKATTAFGLGLVAHDWADRNEWFKGRLR